MVGFRKNRGLLAFIIIAALILGCGSVMTKNKFYGPITSDVQNRNFDAAVAKIEAAKESNQYEKKDRLLYYLDAGFANHFSSKHMKSIENLSNAEDAAEELFTKSVIRAAASMALNDNVLEYSGEDYEILYTNLIKALDFLALGKFDDAFVEIRRSNLKLDLLETKYAKAAEEFKTTKAKDDSLDVNAHLSYDIDKVKFNNDAFARYLSMHIYAAEGKYDDARIDYNKFVEAFRSQPHIYDYSIPEVNFKPQSSDKEIVSVIALAGMAPVKEALNLRIRTDKDLDLVQVLYTDGPKKNSEYSHLPFPVDQDYYFKFSLPVLMERPSRINTARVWTGDDYLGELQLVENISNVAEETFKAKRSLIYFRTIARAIIKGLAAHKAKQDIDKKHEGVGGWLMKAAVDVGTDIIENADLRCSHLLPGKIYIGDFELAPGTYNLRIEFQNSDGYTISTQEITDFEVKKTGWNLAEAYSLN